ncbi:MAG: hypothetical protein GIW95_06355 [Candidatus Eremiobacteraeota bacterium]|nr:hypothetical protein [Candidatus Eremiobacteraeota bacterium]
MFRAAFALLRKNWIIVVPGLVAGAIVGVLSWILAPSEGATPVAFWSGSVPLFGAVALDSDNVSAIALDVAQVLASILAIAYTTGMAHAAWERGTAGLADGRQAFARDAGHVFVAMLGLFFLGLAAVLLAPYTWWFSVALYVYLAIYTMPSAVVGERGGLRAIVESGEIAVRRVVPTTIVVGALALIVFVCGILAEALAQLVPVAGTVLAQLVVQFAIAYFTLVVVGEYLALRELAAIEAGYR